MKRLCVMLVALSLLLWELPAAAEVLSIDGEAYARKSAVLMPPSVAGTWMFTITRLAADGAPVEKGDVVLSFDGTSLIQKRTEKHSKLAEKQSELDTLLLDLAERERTARLATEEAQANLEKAERKTEQPQAMIPGIEYRKLVVAREQATRRMALMNKRERLAAEQRRQERRLLEAEIAELENEVADLGVSIASLDIKASRDGLMMHKSSWGGDKFDVGSQVYRGQSVAEIPDVDSLAVRADLPERALNRVAVGMPVRVVVEGGAGIAVAGRITGIGQAVRSKSRAQPVPVVDLEITLDAAVGKLKPGQVVRVGIKLPDRVAAAEDS
ncbi:HlyD family secretion protein [Lysobacter sp. A286]